MLCSVRTVVHKIIFEFCLFRLYKQAHSKRFFFFSLPLTTHLLLKSLITNMISHRDQQLSHVLESKLKCCYTRQFFLQVATQCCCKTISADEIACVTPLFTTCLTMKNCIANCRKSRSVLHFLQPFEISGSV